MLIRNRGEDFDDRLADYLADIFESTTSASRTRIKTDARAMSRLRAAAERAKRVLSSAMTTKVEVESLSGGKDLSVTITRTEFENCCMDLFKSTTRILDQVLRPIRISSRLNTFFNRDTGVLDPKCIDEVSYILSFRSLNKSPSPYPPYLLDGQALPLWLWVLTTLDCSRRRIFENPQGPRDSL